MAHAVALILATGAWHSAHAQQAFSSAWFAAKGAAQSSAAATGYLPNGMPASSLTNPALQQQQANQQLQTSLNNLAIMARGIAAQQAAQAAARLAATNGPGVPDGLVDGGLKVDTDSLTKGWLNANAPTQTTADGKTVVAIQQTADKAILNWETFNIGKNTIVNFLQQPSWAVLNRVNDPLARPSQIQGQIKGDGTVMIVNRNGIIFSGSSQVDTRNLVAAAAHISNSQFTTGGLYGANGNTASFTDALGSVRVDAGARLSTSIPTSATQGGGYVLLMGSSVDNAGLISTPRGQAELAAGDSFIIRKGVGTNANTASTTRGNEISPQFVAGSTAGTVINSGLLTAPEGDVTLAGRRVNQQGAVVATTTVNNRGTIHLLNSAGDTQGSVTLGASAVTAVLIDDDGVSTVLNGQRDALIAESTQQDQVRSATSTGLFDNLSKLPDRRDQSRVEIVSGNDVNFEGGSMTLASGGQISVSATHRSFVANGASLDVAGVIGVSLPMSSNGLLINVQGNELRDAPVTRDGGLLANSNVWLDTRQLIYVPAGTGGYASDRWYTAGGLLEVGGYVANQGHRIGEWAAQGGTVTLGGSEVVTQTGSSINLSGGTVNVQTGYLNVSWLKGTDGQLYRVDTAPANLSFGGVYKGFEATHARWGNNATEYFYNPLIGPQRVLQNGYTAGRDAGRLVVTAPTVVLEGGITADVYNGPEQNVARVDGVTDGYKLSQRTVARQGALVIGQYGGFGLTGGFSSDVRLDAIADVTSGLNAGDALAPDRIGTTWLDASRLSGVGLGGLTIVSNTGIVQDGALTLADGGQLSFIAPDIDIRSNLTVRGGSVSLGNIMHGILAVNQTVDGWWKLTDAGGNAQVTLSSGANIDLRGVWTNTLQTPEQLAGIAYMNGGKFSADGSGGISTAAGSVIDVSSGGAVQSNGQIAGGKGGDVSLITNDFYHFTPPTTLASLVMDGAVRSDGFNGGGTLKIQAGQAIAFDQPGNATTLSLSSTLLQSGFTDYDITGMSGISVASGVQLQPVVPVYRLTDGLYGLATGSDIAQVAGLWQPPVFVNDPAKGKQTQRVGADLTLMTTRGDFDLAPQAAITVDPGHAVNIYAYGQTTIDGRVTAHGGSITVASANEVSYPNTVTGGTGDFSLTRSIWVGDQAVLDVSGQANTAIDQRGRNYGSVSDGGTIQLGAITGDAPGDAFVVIRPGAQLNASGAAAVIDVASGNVSTPTMVASNGGTIALSSNNGIYIDGNLQAAAGGAGASGGTLNMNLVSRIYVPTDDSIGLIPDEIRKLRNITITQQREASGLGSGAQAGQADAGLLFGNAAISAEQIAQGGFGSLALKTSDLFVFKGDVNLSLPRSLTLSGGIYTVADATPSITVALAAPYVKLDGFTEQIAGDGFYSATLHGVLPSLKFNASSFSVAADLLDITGGVRFGEYGHQGSGWLHWGPNLPDRVGDTNTNDSTTTSGGDIVDAGGFAQVSLASRGDIRFGNGRTTTDNGTAPSGWLKTSGDLTLTAAQIYPMSAATVSIYAGLIALRSTTGGVQGHEGFDPAWLGTIAIRRSSSDTPQQPASVFGRLTMTAPTIDQGGIVRAPLGIVGFNIPGAVFVAPQTTSLIFRNGSITSASANGLIMPFGGTADGVSYQGADGTLFDLGSALVATAGSPRIATGLSVAATSVVGEPGALLDLSGGGTLTGAGFISGRGGSVDTLKTPLVNSNPSYSNVSSKGSQVYAIMPGYASAYAPSIATNGAGDPAIGRQVTIPAGVPGLPAGTYTLLPSSYALLPGAFRVEVGTSGTSGTPGTNSIAPNMMPNGTYVASGVMGVANTDIRDALPTQLLLTPGQAVRTYSQYNETGYADFARTQAALFNNVRPRLPEDGKVLQFGIGASTGVPSLSFAGTANFDPTGDGISGSLLITSSAQNGIIDITAPGAAPVIGHTSISSDDLNAFHAATLFVGGANLYTPAATTGGGSVSLIPVIAGVDSAVNVLDGADLQAGQVFLIGKSISIAGGATIDTRGQSRTGLNSSSGYVFSGGNFIAVANGWLNFLPTTGTGSMTIASGASLLTEDSIVLGAPGALSMGDVNFGARYITVTLDTANVGDAAALVNAQAAGVLPTGWTLSQASLDRLLRPSSSAGVPALERLTLTAGGSINLFGDVTLDARSQSASGVEFVLNTPAIYGLGTSADTATIVADRLVWNGIRTGSVDTSTGLPHYASRAPAAILPNGAGTGAGNLVLQAQDITFGYDKDSRPTDGITLDRIAVGFANVAVNAGNRITGNSDGTLSVGQSKDSSGKLVGGSLTLTSPLVTAEAGATIDYKVGGAIRVTAPAGVAPSDTSVVADLGGTLSFNGDSVFVDTAFALPSGKLTLTAVNDVVIGSNAKIDLAGRTIPFYDVSKFGWGGDLVMQSAHGNITQNADSMIDVSATYNQAGSITAIADDGSIAFNGTLRGSAVSDSQSGRIGLRASSLGDFAALNAMLNQTGFFASRAFVLKQGDLTVGSEVRAHAVSISVDNGSLTVNGVIDASGAAPGTIRLAARDDLTLAAVAILDTHGTQLQTDSYGAPIEANNTAHVDLTSSQGWVYLNPGATIDMRSADGAPRGKLEINASRLGSGGSSATGADAPANATGNDIAISAAGPLNISGAGSIAVNGFSTYTNAPADPDDANGQLIDQAWLDLIHQDSTVFINGALGNADLQNRLAGLKAYASAFHLRPGVTIASATPDGNLTTKGDLDFSNYRYGPGADTVNHTGVGEVGVINFRAGGTLTVKGSINDGFAPPPVSPDALSTLFSGTLGSDYTVTTAGVTLSAGWLTGVFNDEDPAVTVGFALPIGPSFFIFFDPTPSHPIPIDIPLAQDFTIQSFGDTPLGGQILAADGHVLYSATDIVPPGTVIPAGSVLGRGINTMIGAYQAISTSLTSWPANTDLYMVAANSIDKAISLPAGAVLPVNFSLTDVTLTGPGDRKIWATSAMLQPGAQSWSMRLVGGADLAGADSRALRPAIALAPGVGNVVLSDPFNINLTGTGTSSAGVSVVRTGTGNLEILAGGSYRQDSPYGVYTAGTAIAVDSTFNIDRARAADGTVLGSITNPQNAGYEDTLKDAAGNYLPRMYYTEKGGDFLLTAQGDIGGNPKPNGIFDVSDSSQVGNWLWRQGGAGAGQATAWGINFGSYVGNIGGSGAQLGLDAFFGMGALGGGNVTLKAGGDIGNAGQGVVVAIGGSGRVMADGTLRQTGGGTLTVEAGRNVGTGGNQFVNLRGDTAVAAGNFGSMTTFVFGYNGLDPRLLDPLKSFNLTAVAGGSFAPGDGAITVRTRGDLAMGAIDDPGRAGLGQETSGAGGGQTATWFTLWTDRTMVDLAAAGGDASPLSDKQSTPMLPSVMRVAAASGSIFLNPGQDGVSLMMPSSAGELQLLARGSVIEDYRHQAAFGPLSTSTASIATPFNPAWVLRDFDGSGYTVRDSNLWATPDGLRDQLAGFSAYLGRLFAFGPDTISDASAAGNGVKSRIYAVNGDVTGLRYGEVYRDAQGTIVTEYYRAAKPVDILAGGDVVNLGGMILHTDPTDISTIAAGGNVIYVGTKVSAAGYAAGLQIAGPGTLEITAGKNIYQGSNASIESVGAKVSGDTRPGASIVLQAGVGAGTPGVGQVDWTDFAKRYLDPANLAGAGALADQPGKVAKTYDQELIVWLKQRFGYAGDAPLAYFNALAAAQQRIFLRQVYYAELTAGGREFNDQTGPRPGSYVRGRGAIAALFPAPDAYVGDIIMFSAKENIGNRVLSGSVHTDFGGDIQFLAPGGGVTVGTDGLAPGSDAGLITQGSGNIQIYSKKSLLLGLSRIMTTFGGDILAWSAQGDINAGRGSKTTVLYTPPKRVYDDMGNVTLSPQVPSNGAGIATLAPIPEVPAGDIDLIAPLGTIDAGEAGIRVSGNVNLAALQVVNAANIQVQGKAVGIPVIAAVNVGALTNASAAASSAATAAQESVQRARNEARQALPSIFTVRVLGFGNDAPAQTPSSGSAPAQSSGAASRGDQDMRLPVQVMAPGLISEQQRSRLTGEEKRLLGL